MLHDDEFYDEESDEFYDSSHELESTFALISFFAFLLQQPTFLEPGGLCVCARSPCTSVLPPSHCQCPTGRNLPSPPLSKAPTAGERESSLVKMEFGNCEAVVDSQMDLTP